MTTPRSPSAPVPLWIQLADRLRQQISNGEIRGKLPAVAQLAQEHGIGEATARKAVRLLVSEGTVRYVPGLGHFAAGMLSRSTAIHEAGHAVMAFLLGIGFKTISVVEDEDSHGRVSLAPRRGKWLQAEQGNRRLLESHIMILLAGTETEAAWYLRQSGRPEDWPEHVSAGAVLDHIKAVELADYVAGSNAELTAYLEWLRVRVRNKTGRPPTEEEFRLAEDKLDPREIRRIMDGDPLYWALVEALADAVTDRRTMSWHKARQVLASAKDDYSASDRASAARAR